MSDAVTNARSARESLAKGLNALQMDPNVPPQLLDLAAPIAQAMGALHQIERSGGQALMPHAEVAISNVRTALSQLQAAPPSHPAVMAAMEAVAASLGFVHSLHRSAQAPAPVAPQPPSPAPAYPAAPIAAPAPPAQPGYATGGQHAYPAAPQHPYPAPAPQAPAYPTGPQAAYPTGPQPSYPGPQGGYATGAQPAAPAYPAPAPAHYAPTGQAAVYPDPFQQGPTAFQRPSADAFQHAPVPPQAMFAQPGGAPAHFPQAAGGGTVPVTDLAMVNADLGAHSPTNFYKGLSGNDIVDHGGLFVSTYKIPRLGTPVRLKVSLPGGYEFEANAVVRWAREPAEGNNDAPPGFGAQFTEITPEARQLVYRYVRNREPLFHDDL